MRIPTYRHNDDRHLWYLADVHYGDDCCNRQLFRKTISTIASDPVADVLLGGDLNNIAIRNSKSSCYGSMAPKKEYREVMDELEKIQDKIRGSVSSNHHDRVDNEVGLDLDEIISRELKIPYMGALGVVNIVCGRCSYIVAFHHGKGSGKRQGSKANDLEDLGDLVQGADIFCQAHTHSFQWFQSSIPYIDRKRGLFSYHTAHYVTTGHYLNYDGSYAQTMKLRPKPLGTAMLTLHANNTGNSDYKKVEVSLFS